MLSKTDIRARALAEGFGQVGFAIPQIKKRHQTRLQEFVTLKQHGTMGWMEERLDERLEPKVLWDGVQTVISLGYSYAPEGDVQARLDDPGLANISTYAWGQDYHDIVKKAAKRLGRWLIAQEEDETEIKVFVDTAPVMEKPLAAQAGL